MTAPARIAGAGVAAQRRSAALCEAVPSVEHVSLVSRLWRVTELRASGVVLDETARRYVDEAGHGR